MIESLGQSEYGVYSIVLPMVSYLNLFSFGLGSAYTRFYTRYKEAGDKYNMAKLNGMFLIIYSIIGIVVLIVGFTIAANPRLAFGQKLTDAEIDLAGLDKLTVQDAINAQRQLFNEREPAAMLLCETTTAFVRILAAKATGLPIEFF